MDTQGGLLVGIRSTNNIAIAKDAPDNANVTEVQTGSIINSIYLKVEIYATSTAALANAYLAVLKNPGGQLTLVNPNVIGVSAIKKFVIHQEMVMMEKNTTGNPRTLFAGVIKIPRGYRRMGTDDILQLMLVTPGVTADFCFQSIYKEYQ